MDVVNNSSGTGDTLHFHKKYFDTMICKHCLLGRYYCDEIVLTCFRY